MLESSVWIDEDYRHYYDVRDIFFFCMIFYLFLYNLPECYGLFTNERKDIDEKKRRIS